MLHNIRPGVTQVRQALSDKRFFVLFFGSCSTGCNNGVTCGDLDIGWCYKCYISQPSLHWNIESHGVTVRRDKDPVSCIIRLQPWDMRHSRMEFRAEKIRVSHRPSIGSSLHCCSFSASISSRVNIHLNPGSTGGDLSVLFLQEIIASGAFMGRVNDSFKQLIGFSI